LAVIVPVSAILPTRNRAPILARFLETLARQSVLPAEIVICDGSDNDETNRLFQTQRPALGEHVQLVYERAARIGLAPQRNQAVARASQPYVWFLDDDILLEPDCLHHLFSAIDHNPAIGGVTATLTNQFYQHPGPWTLFLMQWFENGVRRKSYASACIGPGWTFWPDASPDAPALGRAEWLIGCCSLYRRVALPNPPVPDHFEGGAFGEDLAASLSVGLRWEMWHVLAARVLHDSQGGDHKRNIRRMADQTLRNRWFIMTKVMGKDTPRDVLDLVLMHMFLLIAQFRYRSGWTRVFPMLAGWFIALCKLRHSSRSTPPL
jgi:glycosyltransferase involved in cell wall biosynthesis